MQPNCMKAEIVHMDLEPENIQKEYNLVKTQENNCLTIL